MACRLRTRCAGMRVRSFMCSTCRTSPPPRDAATTPVEICGSLATAWAWRLRAPTLARGLRTTVETKPSASWRRSTARQRSAGRKSVRATSRRPGRSRWRAMGRPRRTATAFLLRPRTHRRRTGGCKRHGGVASAGLPDTGALFLHGCLRRAFLTPIPPGFRGAPRWHRGGRGGASRA